MDRDSFESALALALQKTASPEPNLPVVLRAARRRLALRDMASFVLARIWLALARLLAPIAVRIHRLSHSSN
ncbi:hypothetical protein [Candidatus Igneacidithiobacillus taiwanensis]|uniref:hypothetical protein n=1 Tax=Candidatus Igneacidithiobacillus taiwanensis TaxID=1945924 RepID=UPI0028A19405|nr:hypothetical protein [Candidatus Igneacidithiobacillus taiwanensis]MCE5359690.1 hypothetical protein [Acidithiobacillus sp.]